MAESPKKAATAPAEKPRRARKPKQSEPVAEPASEGAAVKPAHPKGTPDPTPNENVDPVLRVRDPELAAAAGAVDERFDLVGADGRTIVRNVSYQAAADHAARISGVTGEKLEIVATGSQTES